MGRAASSPGVEAGIICAPGKTSRHPRSGGGGYPPLPRPRAASRGVLWRHLPAACKRSSPEAPSAEQGRDTGELKTANVKVATGEKDIDQGAPTPHPTPPRFAEESTCGEGFGFRLRRSTVGGGPSPSPGQASPEKERQPPHPASCSGQASAPSKGREGLRPDAVLSEAAAAGGVASEPGTDAPVSSQREALLPRGPKLAVPRVSAANSARREGKAGGEALWLSPP